MKKRCIEDEIVSYLDQAGEMMRAFQCGRIPSKRQKTRFRALLEQYHNEGHIDDLTYHLIDSDFKSAEF